jgi:hypothetical protein
MKSTTDSGHRKRKKKQQLQDQLKNNRNLTVISLQQYRWDLILKIVNQIHVNQSHPLLLLE